MRTVNMHEAKTHLSRLVRDAVDGKPFIIARAGKPMVKVVSLEEADSKTARRTGFLSGRISVPRDFDHMGCREITAMFAGEE